MRLGLSPPSFALGKSSRPPKNNKASSSSSAASKNGNHVVDPTGTGSEFFMAQHFPLSSSSLDSSQILIATPTVTSGLTEAFTKSSTTVVSSTLMPPAPDGEECSSVSSTDSTASTSCCSSAYSLPESSSSLLQHSLLRRNSSLSSNSSSESSSSHQHPENNHQCYETRKSVTFRLERNQYLEPNHEHYHCHVRRTSHTKQQQPRVRSPTWYHSEELMAMRQQAIAQTREFFMYNPEAAMTRTILGSLYQYTRMADYHDHHRHQDDQQEQDGGELAAESNSTVSLPSPLLFAEYATWAAVCGGTTAAAAPPAIKACTSPSSAAAGGCTAIAPPGCATTQTVMQKSLRQQLSQQVYQSHQAGDVVVGMEKILIGTAAANNKKVRREILAQLQHQNRSPKTTTTISEQKKQNDENDVMIQKATFPARLFAQEVALALEDSLVEYKYDASFFDLYVEDVGDDYDDEEDPSAGGYGILC